MLSLRWQCAALSSIFHLCLMLALFDSSSQCMNSQWGWMCSVTRQLCHQCSCQQNTVTHEICPVVWIFLLCHFLKFPEETEVDLLSISTDEPSHPYHHNHPHSPSVLEGQHVTLSAPVTPAVFSPVPPFQHDEMRRDDLSSSSSEDSEKEDEFERERPSSYRRPLWVCVVICWQIKALLYWEKRWCTSLQSCVLRYLLRKILHNKCS